MILLEAGYWSLDWNVVGTILFGALSGYIASRLLGGEGFGFFGNIIVGVIGGFIGTWLVALAKIQLMSGFFGNLISSVAGALVFIFFIEIVKRMRDKPTRSKSKR